MFFTSGLPNPLDPHRELAPRQRLRDHPDQLYFLQELRTVDLDDEAEDVLTVHVDGARIGERELAGRDRLQRRRGVHDERIPARAGEHPHAMTGAALLVVHSKGDRVACRRRAYAFLSSHAVTRGGIGEHAVEHELLLGDGERRRVARGSRRERAQPEAVDKPVREQRRGLRKRKRVLHEHELPLPLWAWKRVHVRDVRDRLRQRPRSRDVIRHRLLPSPAPD
jgi:hypothetical protein